VIVARHSGGDLVARVASHVTVPVALADDHEPPPTTPTTTSTTTTTTTVARATPVAVVRDQVIHDPTVPVPTTTTTTLPPPLPVYGETGLASWYPEARLGYCASPYLLFGTVVTVTDEATGAYIQCTVDDRQARNPGRVIDLSYEGFAELAYPSRGLVEVHLTW
jgi:rare lipoprotein A (peptidoglycan hydrolase)